MGWVIDNDGNATIEHNGYSAAINKLLGRFTYEVQDSNGQTVCEGVESDKSAALAIVETKLLFESSTWTKLPLSNSLTKRVGDVFAVIDLEPQERGYPFVVAEDLPDAESAEVLLGVAPTVFFAKKQVDFYMKSLS